ncbi:hypothetical protein PC129_g20696 [Phytophthora cactorum]|uniref:C2H2-type domain-containing protein n=2 Tax=Phytophthora cactorum TaxID=29920 RepID=A0A8T1H809_9STRA|nr:hypothetical protein PC112_g20272 [Phytophthora cactorum]KAG2880168.1 hypothetical protein PC114_g22197 [Phytophthora cactorum]KAG2889268.1 hypothetical protein PC115_g19787 [Phytophthora cactorum]KAG2965172.1 hypothetical protein PC118_g19896 [Phytophthora cactorum]KAG3059592.1 hypothetical protein PC122_g20249 [Phytophthora cactorum]
MRDLGKTPAMARATALGERLGNFVVYHHERLHPTHRCTSSPSEFYDKLENVLASQKSAFKINIVLGYNLVSRTDESETRYFHTNLSNTSVFRSPVAINSKADIRKKVIAEIRSMELADKLNYPKSGYLVKAITGFKIFNYQRDHALCDSKAVIPKVIRDNKSVINFPKTNNKCVFHCIAYHKQEGSKRDPRRIQALVKQAFKQYCSYKDSSYTLNLFRSFKPIDILQFDELEECFQLSINVFATDVETRKVEYIRRSDKDYDVINILSHEHHALYIKNIDMLQCKYQCAKCEMVFVSSDKLRNHKKNQCEIVNIEYFPEEPTIYRPATNTIRSLLTKYSITKSDHYIDHFIVYDFEAILKPTTSQHGGNTVFTNGHIPVSVSVADDLTQYLSPSSSPLPDDDSAQPRGDAAVLGRSNAPPVLAAGVQGPPEASPAALVASSVISHAFTT